MKTKIYEHENTTLRTAEEGSDTVRIPIMYKAVEKVKNVFTDKVEEYPVGPELWEEFKDNYAKAAQGSTNGKPNDLPINEGHDRKGRAVGWITNIDYNDTELYADVKWNNVGKDLIENDIYRQFSVEFNDEKFVDGFGNEYGSTLRGGAVTNIPWYKDLEPLRVKHYGDNDMADDIKNEDQVEETEVKETEDKSIDERVDEVTKDADKEALLIKRLEVVEQQNAKLTALLEAQDKRETDNVVEAALKTGKITPAQKDVFTELATENRSLFDKLIEVMPVQVDFTERGVVGNKPEDNDTEQARINKMNELIADGMERGKAYDVVYQGVHNPAAVEYQNKKDMKGRE